MKNEDKPEPPKKREEALAERFLRRVLEGVGDVVDRKLWRSVETKGGLTATDLFARLKRAIDERVRHEPAKGTIAPHLLKLKIEWGTHSEAPPEVIKDLETQVLAAAIDHINDSRYRTLAPPRVETETDIFTTGISVDPTFGEFEEELREQDEAARSAAEHGAKPKAAVVPQAPKEMRVTARASLPGGKREVPMVFVMGGKRLNVGRGSDNELCLDDASVSKIHAALLMNGEGTLLVADTGSTNGTYINGRRIAYGEARSIEEGDVVGFGDVEVRFRKQSS